MDEYACIPMASQRAIILEIVLAFEHEDGPFVASTQFERILSPVRLLSCPIHSCTELKVKTKENQNCSGEVES
jgi:hypothetical protein